MSLGHGSSIVRSGLVLHLDAANRKSYSGSGTTWSDLSSNLNNVTLVNGPTYSSTNAGLISFDGTNDYAEVTARNTVLEFQPSQPFTQYVWFRTSSIPGSGSIISNMISTNPYTGYDLWVNGSNQLACHLISSWNADAVKIKVDYNYNNFLNTWVCFAATYDGSTPATSQNALNSMDFYINGSLYTTGKAIDTGGGDGFNTTSSTITYSSSQRFRIASRWSSNALAQGLSVTVSNVLIYNRKLNGAEIRQNFNALRGRYGV